MAKKKSKTSCNCLEDLKKALLEKHGEGSKVKVDVDMWLDFSNGTSGVRFKGIQYSYLKQKKDGTYYANASHSSVTHNYCPICGVKVGQ